MLLLIEQGKADGILSWHPDRLARNPIDGGRIIYMVDTGKIKSLKFPSFWFEDTPQGKFMLNIAFGQSKYFIDNLSENVKRGLRQKLQNGVYPGWAPLGYLNEPKYHNIIVDPVKHKLIRKLFEVYATGEHTLEGLTLKFNDLGLTSVRDKALQLSMTHRMLRSPFYYGLFKYKGETYQGKHEPIIALVEKTQAEIRKTEIRLDNLLNDRIDGIIEKTDYVNKKDSLIKNKLDLADKIKEIKDKGNNWLEPMRDFILRSKLAKKTADEGDLSELKAFLKNIGSNFIIK